MRSAVASFSVKYMFDFLTKGLDNLPKAGAAAKKMGADLNAAGNAAKAMGSSLAGVAGSAERAAAAARRVADSFAAQTRATKEAQAALERLNRVPNKAAAILPARKELERLGYVRDHATGTWSAKKDAKGGEGNTVVGWGGKLMNTWAGLQLAKGFVHGVDSTLEPLAEVDTIRRKLALALGNDDSAFEMADKSLDLAKQLSGKYKNTKIAENMHIIDDLRANLPESMEEILGHSTEPFVKMHSFFKGYAGGKHGDVGHQVLKDIGIAIRSGELLGNIGAEDVAKHAQALAVSRVVQGEKFNLQQYFTAQRYANQSLPGASDEFKYVIFPSLVNRLGSRAGTGLATLYNKMVGGISNKGYALDYANSLGLLDPAMLASGEIKQSKKGGIMPQALPAGAIVGQKAAATDPHLWVMDTILPALAKGKKLGQFMTEDAKALSNAWKTGNVAELAKMVKKINKQDLTQALTPLGADRMAVNQLFETIMGLPSFLREKNLFDKLMGFDTDSYRDYNKAKQEVAAQADRLVQEMTGKDFIGNVTAALGVLADHFNRATEAVADMNRHLTEKEHDPRNTWQIARDLVMRRPDFDRSDYSWGSAEQDGRDAYADFESRRGRAFSGLRNGAGALSAASIPQSTSVAANVNATFAPATINVQGTVDASGLIKLQGQGTTQATQSGRGTAAPEIGPELLQRGELR